MEDVPKISETEWKVMKVIWSNPYITANDVIDILDDSVEWKPKTVKTLLNRLLNKKVIHFAKEGREYKYYPLISEDKFILVFFTVTSCSLKALGSLKLKL